MYPWAFIHETQLTSIKCLGLPGPFHILAWVLPIHRSKVLWINISSPGDIIGNVAIISKVVLTA
jgi:hypothetical protein